MKLFRVVGQTGADSFAVKWTTTQSRAVNAQLKMAAKGIEDVEIQGIYIPTTKIDLCEWLNERSV